MVKYKVIEVLVQVRECFVDADNDEDAIEYSCDFADADWDIVTFCHQKTASLDVDLDTKKVWGDADG